MTKTYLFEMNRIDLDMRKLLVIIGLVLVLTPIIPTSSDVDDTEVNSTGNPPVVTDLGGGIDNWDDIKVNFTGAFPWEHPQYWGLYWYAEFTCVLRLFTRDISFEHVNYEVSISKMAPL